MKRMSGCARSLREKITNPCKPTHCGSPLPGGGELFSEKREQKRRNVSGVLSLQWVNRIFVRYKKDREFYRLRTSGKERNSVTGIRGIYELELTVAGNTAICAESIIKISNLTQAANGEWIIKSATHELSNSGYVTQINAIIKD